MTKIKVSSLQPGPQMDALVARAKGWTKEKRGSIKYPPMQDFSGAKKELGKYLLMTTTHPPTVGGVLS